MACKLRVFIPDAEFLQDDRNLKDTVEGQLEIVGLVDLQAHPLSCADITVAICHLSSFGIAVEKLNEGLLPSLQLIVNIGVGVHHIPFQLLKEKGIRVANTPNVLSDATADMAMTLMMASGRRLVKGFTLAKEWGQDVFKIPYLGQDISNMTLGIIGMGSIGYKVALRAAAFNMKIFYHNRTRRNISDEEAVGACFCESLHEMLPKCDYVIISCPLTEETSKLFKNEEFKLMKPTAHLINIARGKVVDTDSLVEALRNNEIAAAALDVTDPEPLPRDHPLLQLENVIITPHWGTATVQARLKMLQLAIDNAIQFASDESLITEVVF